MPNRKKPDYSVRLIRTLLAGYAELEQGNTPFETEGDAGVKSRQGSRRRNMAEIFKADMDRAIRVLSPRQKFVIICCDIECRNPHDIAYWLGSTVSDLLFWEKQAIIRMSNCLGGE